MSEFTKAEIENDDTLTDTCWESFAEMVRDIDDEIDADIELSRVA